MIREAAVEESITVYSVQKNLLLAPPAPPINKIQQRYAVQLIRLSTAKNGCKLIARVYDKKFFMKTQNKVKLEVKKHKFHTAIRSKKPFLKVTCFCLTSKR